MITDETQLTLQNGGHGTCAVAYQTGFLTIGGAGDSGTHGKVDRYTIVINLFLSFCLRYNSEGKYLDSLPDLATPRMHHACASFLTGNGEQVKISSCCPILFLLYFKQTLLVAGGWDNNVDPLSTTELYFPLMNRWTTGGHLPR